MQALDADLIARIPETLARNGGRQRQTARELGIARNSLRKWLLRLGDCSAAEDCRGRIRRLHAGWRLTDEQSRRVAENYGLVSWGKSRVLRRFPGLRRREDEVISACHLAICRAAHAWPRGDRTFAQVFTWHLRSVMWSLLQEDRPLGYRDRQCRAGAPGTTRLGHTTIDDVWCYRDPEPEA